MANFSQMDNAFAQQYIQQNCANDPIYNKVKNYVAQTTGGGFLPDRATAFVGTDPNNSGSSYVLVIEPTFKSFKSTDPNHQAGSMVSYFADGLSSFAGSIAIINHNPYQVQNLALVEYTTDGIIAQTPVDRGAFTSLDVNSVATLLSRTSYDPNKIQTITTQPTPTDLAAIASVAMGGFTSDKYAAGLYPPGALSQLLNDSSVPAMFSQAAALKTAANSNSIKIVLCTSTSCNGCSSCSSTIKISVF